MHDSVYIVLSQVDYVKKITYTGKCTEDDRCEIVGWCPTEWSMEAEEKLALGIEWGSIFVKIAGKFPDSGKF